MKYAIVLLLVLAVVWLAWSGIYDNNLLFALGAASCVVVVAISRRLGIVDSEGVPIAITPHRYAVSCDDVREIAKSALRHRVMVNFHGISEGITSDQIIETVLSHVNQPNAEALA